MPPVDVEESITIDCPRARVADYAMDPRHDTEWVTNFAEVELLTPLPVGVGTKVRRVARFMGKRIDYVLEVVDHEPQALLGMRSVKSPFPMRITYAFADADAGTRASIRVQGDTGGFYGVAGGLMNGRVRRDVRADLERLKQRMESGGV